MLLHPESEIIHGTKNPGNLFILELSVLALSALFTYKYHSNLHFQCGALLLQLLVYAVGGIQQYFVVLGVRIYGIAR